jgi:hypothetical protein
MEAIFSSLLTPSAGAQKGDILGPRQETEIV